MSEPEVTPGVKGESKPGWKPGFTPESKPAVAGAAADNATAESLRAAAPPVQRKPAAALGATLALLALIALTIAWEWWLAPLRPGGSALVLKALPLLLALPGVWRHRLYTLQWASMLILLYFAEGVVRGWSDHGLSARLGWLQAALAVIFFVCTLAYVAPFKRAAKRAAKAAAKQAAAEPQSPATTRDATAAATSAAASPVGTSPVTGAAATQTATHSATGAAATQPATRPATSPATTTAATDTSPDRGSRPAPSP
jgi:uncharacterized membrane protein